MKRLASVCLLPVALILTGCPGGGPSGPKVEPTLDYANMVRAMVMELKQAEGGPKVAIESFAENMAEYESEALGEHKATYDQIAKLAQELQSMKESASDAELTAKIDELVAVADKLPGEWPKMPEQREEEEDHY